MAKYGNRSDVPFRVSSVSPASPLRAVPPTVEIIVPDVAVSPLQTEWAVEFIWNQSITDFDDSTDIETEHCTITSFAGEGRFWSGKLTLEADMLEAASITVLANSVNYGAGTAPASDTSYAFMYDTRNIPDPSIGNVTWIRQFDFDALPDLDTVLQVGETSGGSYSGCLDIETLGNFAYIVVQIQKYGHLFSFDAETGIPTTENSVITTRQAGAGLFRLDLTNGTYTLLKAYPSVTLAARSLIAFDNKVWFFEGTYQAYLNEGLVFNNPDDETTSFRQTRLAGVPDDWKSRIGRLCYVENGSDTINVVGLNWISSYPDESPYGVSDPYYGIHGATASPIVIKDNAPHLLTGYGKLDNIGIAKDEVSRSGNWNLIRYSTGINRKIPLLVTNDRSGFELIKELSVLGNCVIGINNDTVEVQPRLALQATLNVASFLADSATEIPINALSEDFTRYPASGLVSINQELIQYTDIDNDSINTFTRGYNGTTVAQHAMGSKVFWVDHYITISQLRHENPVLDIRQRFTTQNIYNRIVINYAEEQYITEDATSQAKYGIREFSVTLNLEASNEAWVKSIADIFLDTYKAQATIADIRLLPSPHIREKDVLFLHIPDRAFLSRPFYVVSVSHTIQVSNDAVSNTVLKIVSLI